MAGPIVLLAEDRERPQGSLEVLGGLDGADIEEVIFVANGFSMMYTDCVVNYIDLIFRNSKMVDQIGAGVFGNGDKTSGRMCKDPRNPPDIKLLNEAVFSLDDERSDVVDGGDGRESGMKNWIGDAGRKESIEAFGLEWEEKLLIGNPHQGRGEGRAMREVESKVGRQLKRGCEVEAPLAKENKFCIA